MRRKNNKWHRVYYNEKFTSEYDMWAIDQGIAAHKQTCFKVIFMNNKLPSSTYQDVRARDGEPSMWTAVYGELKIDNDNAGRRIATIVAR